MVNLAIAVVADPCCCAAELSTLGYGLLLFFVFVFGLFTGYIVSR